ncbi:hypothetical protein HCN44_007480 [Aphidius gifuensis]|uniref:Peptidase S1 domain-containing protein n=2 Tax=Aphidius gifuensis TaxID=684658 RepID=A0A834XPN1_APHGI|nr:hypothetical protein HCN44_007480 [Aphidius gifuensis]
MIIISKCDRNDDIYDEKAENSLSVIRQYNDYSKNENYLRYETEENDKSGKKSSIIIETLEKYPSLKDELDYLVHDQSLNNNEPSYLEYLEEYPSKVVLHYIDYNNNYKKNKYNLCGGVLVTNSYVLTSSNCFYNNLNLNDPTIANDDPRYYKISLFADTLTNNWKKKLLNIKKINIKSLIDGGEMAMLKLEKEIKRSPITNHAFLPEFNINVDENVTILQHAHSLDLSISNKPVEKLKKGIIKVMNSHYLHLSDDNNFNDIFFGIYQSRDTGFCNILLGDPIYNETTAVGILQVVHDCDDAKYPLVLTDIFKHKNWIVDGLINGFY